MPIFWQTLYANDPHDDTGRKGLSVVRFPLWPNFFSSPLSLKVFSINWREGRVGGSVSAIIPFALWSVDFGGELICQIGGEEETGKRGLERESGGASESHSSMGGGHAMRGGTLTEGTSRNDVRSGGSGGGYPREDVCICFHR